MADESEVCCETIMKRMHFKSEIAQLELSDLGREGHAQCLPTIVPEYNLEEPGNIP